MKTDFSPRRLDIGAVDEVPEQFGLSFSVRVADPVATAAEPPRIRISLSNARSRRQEYWNGSTEVFGGRISTGDPPRLLLLQPGYPIQLGDVPLRPIPGTISFDMPLVRTRLEPNETKSVEYDIWDGSDEGEPFPTGSYRFEDTYERNPSGDATDDRFTWGFSVGVHLD